MYRIQTLDKIDQQGLSHLPEEIYETGIAIPDPDAVILRSFNMHDMAFPASLRAIARAGAGVNNIPVERCTQQGIVVFNTPGANANGVKELVLAGLLLTSRDISGGIEWVKTLTDKGEQIPGLVEKGKKNFAGNEISGKTLAVIGLGAIGVLVANSAHMLGMEVIGFDPHLSVSSAKKLNEKIRLSRSVETAISKADYISVHIPLLPETTGYIDRNKIKLMKNGVRILNFARGELINTNDLSDALEEGKISWYMTDFPDERTLKMKHAICVPHLGASTDESEVNCVVMAVEQLREFFERGNIINSVNYPNVEMDRSGGLRIVIANKNIPAMVSQISAILAGEGVNILNMINKNRNDIAYNIIDIDKNEINHTVREQIGGIKGVFMVRIIE